MDPVSVAIVVAVLSAGLLLVLIFKQHFDRRGHKSALGGATKNANKTARCVPQPVGKPNASLPPTKAAGTTKQVHFADIISTSSNDQDNSNKKQHNGHNATPGHTNQVATAKTNMKQYKNAKKTKNINENADNNNETLPVNKTNALLVDPSPAPTMTVPSGPEPSVDELDSSAFLAPFNPTKLAKIKSTSQPQATTNEKKTTRKRQSSEQTSYSSEKLFAMIAASNLSKDEVELAIETLLNKMESGESDWRQPKSDPMQRLKNQLRDSETALQTETQNHKQTRARLVELKSQLQAERSSKNLANEEVAKVKKELGVVNLALERAQCDLSKQRMLHEKIKDESSKVIAKLEQDNVHLQTLLAKANVHNDEIAKLRIELDEKIGQLQRYELTNQSLSKKVQEFEASLRTAEIKLDQFRSNKQQDDYEACAKISELESDRLALDKALKDHIARLKEVSETNNLLEKSIKELQIMNGRQDDMLKRLRDERHLNETSMKRTLCEMEQELRELQEKLSAKSATSDERLRKEINQFERELNDAGQREQKLASEVRQLREGLSELFPDLRPDEQNNADDWVHKYLLALKQLAQTVDDLRRVNDNNNNIMHNNNVDRPCESPSKRSVVDKSTLTLQTNGISSRVGSPTSNGRSSSRASGKSDYEKKLMETKLVELNDYVTKLEETVKKLENEREADSDRLHSKQQIKELTLQRNKLEAQIKFGLDSFKMEQERARRLEMELAKYSSNIHL